MSKATVGVMLTLYNRPQYLIEQIEAVRAQTHEVAKIWCWHQPGDTDVGNLLGRAGHVTDRIFHPEENTGVWSRFYASLELETDFVLILDDDTIPGPGWVQNCLDTYERVEAPLGAVGIIYGERRDGRGERPNGHREGWCSGNNRAMMVDHIGHAWFLPMEMLRLYDATDACQITHLAGEDYHLSWAIKQHLGIRPWVPPHPAGDRDIWGSLKGVDYGCDPAALFTQPGQSERLHQVHLWYVGQGWKTMHDEANGI